MIASGGDVGMCGGDMIRNAMVVALVGCAMVGACAPIGGHTVTGDLDAVDAQLGTLQVQRDAMRSAAATSAAAIEATEQALRVQATTTTFAREQLNWESRGTAEHATLDAQIAAATATAGWATARAAPTATAEAFAVQMAQRMTSQAADFASQATQVAWDASRERQQALNDGVTGVLRWLPLVLAVIILAFLGGVAYATYQWVAVRHHTAFASGLANAGKQLRGGQVLLPRWGDSGWELVVVAQNKNSQFLADGDADDGDVADVGAAHGSNDWILTANGGAFAADWRKYDDAQLERYRTQALRLLRSAAQLEKRWDGQRIPGWRELPGWSGEGWSETVGLLGDYVEKRPGRGTFIRGDVTLMGLYDAVRTKRLIVHPAESV